MNLFIDTNVLMDMITCRFPFADSAIQIFQLKEKGYRLFVSDLTYANVVYCGRKKDFYFSDIPVLMPDEFLNR